MVKLRIHRTDGKQGVYTQPMKGAAAQLLKRLDPLAIFASPAIVIGVHNPFNIISTNQVCYVEVTTELETLRRHSPGIDNIRLIPDRDEYEKLLARQWPLWRTNFEANKSNLLEALLEVSLVSGEVLYMHVTGRAPLDWVELTAPKGALVAAAEPNVTLYVNPQAIVRARVYHSQQKVDYPEGLWFADAEDI